VIGAGLVDVDARLPVAGGLAEVRAIRQVEEDGLKVIAEKVFDPKQVYSTPKK